MDSFAKESDFDTPHLTIGILFFIFILCNITKLLLKNIIVFLNKKGQKNEVSMAVPISIFENYTHEI